MRINLKWWVWIILSRLETCIELWIINKNAMATIYYAEDV